MGWYSEVSRDISKIPQAVAYFENEIVDARKEVKLVGNVERAAASMPGIVEQRFNQLQEIEAILNYLNIELRRLRSSYFKKYLETSLGSAFEWETQLIVAHNEKYLDKNKFEELENKVLQIQKMLGKFIDNLGD